MTADNFHTKYMSFVHQDEDLLTSTAHFQSRVTILIIANEHISQFIYNSVCITVSFSKRDNFPENKITNLFTKLLRTQQKKIKG